MEIEVFKTGLHTDSAGNAREWNEGDLDNIVENYNSRTDDAPVVVGHPKADSPAYGWVSGLKRAGNVLTASLKDVNPDFKKMVTGGAFKNRSIALNPDLTLRHVGFLGAMAPAVKGLKPVQFKDHGAASEFELPSQKPISFSREAPTQAHQAKHRRINPLTRQPNYKPSKTNLQNFRRRSTPFSRQTSKASL